MADPAMAGGSRKVTAACNGSLQFLATQMRHPLDTETPLVACSGTAGGKATKAVACLTQERHCMH